ncbi:hypothetical protein [Gordonibacter massiliensis (ex Traore et al. 2017)]|uniref:Uncharacterized protein n=1 Tax=Gordonibacter massiliensis (ex Traore et al. 2017) TaxID=1841863 RepID=A0A842JCQ5_9ACTN|nr:hypothetical protein [Gordonibacter massiliensis (ex Traore et al. 2017)]MBC2889713.1 hypothetical protein [Gordonibacter massiliensis (ex Traore et al. 2017)]
MDKQELRKLLLNGNKTERVNFAVTPALKSAVSKLAEDQCVSIGGLIVTMLADAVVESDAKEPGSEN